MRSDNLRYYPPDWCSAATMAYLLDMAESTFRGYVARGLMPVGVTRGGSVRWPREKTLAAWEGRAAQSDSPRKSDNDNAEDIQANILESIKRHGAAKKARG